jgi:hypothetical protein
MPEERRSALQVDVLHQSLVAVDVADETIDQFDRCRAEAYARAGLDLEEFLNSGAEATNETVRLCSERARVVFDLAARATPLRPVSHRRVPATRLQRCGEEPTRIVRPDEDGSYNFLSISCLSVRHLSEAITRAALDPSSSRPVITCTRRTTFRSLPSMGVGIFQSMEVPSRHAARILFPSGLNAMALTRSGCSRGAPIGLPSVALQNRTVLSSPAVAAS